MNIEALDDDCFKAILTRLPFEDFVRRARLVSTRFHQGTELALDQLVELQPLWLEVYGNCKHMRALAGHGYDDASRSNSEPATPQITLGGIQVPSSKFSILPTDCKYLANVSKVHLYAASCESLPSEFRSQLCEILRSLPPSAASLKYSPDTFTCSSYGPQQSFLELTQHCGNWISTLESIELPAAVACTPKNKSDFYRLLILTERLRSLTAVVGLLFDAAGRVPAAPLARLEKLVLETRANHERGLSTSFKVTCQHVLETVCEHCPNLLDFSFTCSDHEDHTCVSDFRVLQNLSKLRNFYISLRHEKDYPLRVGTLSSVESMTLYIPWTWQSCRLLSLLRMAPNLKSLRTSFVEEFELVIDDIVAMLTRQRQQCQLKFLSIVYPAVPSQHLYGDYDKLFTLPSSISLRRVKWRNPDEYTVLQLNVILSMIWRTENIAQFELCVKWHQEAGLVQLQHLLEAMQLGSIRQLILHDGFVCDDMIPLDKEFFCHLPAGCKIREWNITTDGCQPNSILISGYKFSDGAEGPDSSRDLFWVHLVTDVTL